jgi:hypothetical protein
MIHSFESFLGATFDADALADDETAAPPASTFLCLTNVCGEEKGKEINCC